MKHEVEYSTVVSESLFQKYVCSCVNETLNSLSLQAYTSRMWIFTDIGFFSVVRHWKRSDKMVVRARCKEDLACLIDRHGTFLGRSHKHILDTPASDYCCRIIVDTDKWSCVLSKIACDVDYTNFKDTVHRRMGHERASVYTDVWCTMYDMQHSMHSSHKNNFVGSLNTAKDQNYYPNNETPTNTSRGENTNG